MLVEDNTGNCEMVRFLFERAGYQVLESHNGQMGLDLARQELPDLVLMDLSLPGVDGWTAARELKADPKFWYF
ncbi:MAG: response regulator [Candidatus Atribacteria bacterium]|nr:response regulator [Candidatus Atribacteria bacterium]